MGVLLVPAAIWFTLSVVPEFTFAGVAKKIGISSSAKPVVDKKTDEFSNEMLKQQPAITLPNGVVVESSCTAGVSTTTAIAVAFPVKNPVNTYGAGVNLAYPGDVSFFSNLDTVKTADDGNFPTAIVRSAINLPFNKTQSYTKSCTRYKADKVTCDMYTYNTFSLSSYITSSSPTKALDFLSQNDTQQYFTSTNGVYRSTGSIQDKYLSGSMAAKDFYAQLVAKKIDWLEVMFEVPYDFVTACNKQALADCAYLTPGKGNDFALFKAAKVVYQARYGIVPKYIELFNEPEGGWGIRISSAEYPVIETAFKTYLNQLIEYRLTQTKDAAEIAALNQLRSLTVVAPGLGSAFKFSVGTDHSQYFPDEVTIRNFFATVSKDKAILSSHMYDEKFALQPIDSLRNFLITRDRYATGTKPDVILTESAASVEESPQAQSYTNFCDSYCKVDRNNRSGTYPTSSCAKNTTANFCKVAKSDDVKFNFYSYPSCVTDTNYASSTFAPVVNFCHYQNAVLYRNLTSYLGEGVQSVLAWTFTQNDQSSRHGLVIKNASTTVKTDMYNTLRNFYKAAFLKRATYKPLYTNISPDIVTKQSVSLLSATDMNAASLTFANTSEGTNKYVVTLPADMPTFWRVTATESAGGDATKNTSMDTLTSTSLLKVTQFCPLVVTVPKSSTLLLSLTKKEAN